MREILFRGKRIDNGEWTEGYFIERSTPEYCAYIVKPLEAETDDKCINTIKFDIAEIIPETAGQYTGLKDKSGKKIFEGDMVHCFGGEYAFGYWEHDMITAVTFDRLLESAVLTDSIFAEIIGNVCDNPELKEKP